MSVHQCPSRANYAWELRIRRQAGRVICGLIYTVLLIPSSAETIANYEVVEPVIIYRDIIEVSKMVDNYASSLAATSYACTVHI